MLSHVDIDPSTMLIITSDKCCCQFESSKNFFDLQRICNDYQISLICIYGVAGHGKNEVNAVGGVAKIAIPTAISQGQSFFNAADCLSYISGKFNSYEKPLFWIKLIKDETLEKECLDLKYTKYPIMKGSIAF